MSVLKKIGSLRPADFRSVGKKSGGSSAPVKEGGKKLFTFRLDGSVEKVTVSGLSIELCIRHASWTVSIPETIVAAKEEGE